MTPNNNLNPLAFYKSQNDMFRARPYNYGIKYPLYMPLNRVTPFQIIRGSSESTTLTSAKIYNDRGVEVATVTSYMSVNVVTIGSSKVMQFKCGNYANLTPGQYTMRVVIGNDTYYSEVFTAYANIGKLVKVEYYNADPIIFDEGALTYDNGFKFELYLCTEIAKPEYLFEEESTKRGGFTFVENQISSKQYKMVIAAPEYLCDAIRIIRLHDHVAITKDGNAYEAYNFTPSYQWNDVGDLAQVTITFESNTVLQKISAYKGSQSVFKNALLAAASVPIMFSPNVIAQYGASVDGVAEAYTEFTGKLIRQLEEQTTLPKEAWVAIDTGTGEAKKMSIGLLGGGTGKPSELWTNDKKIKYLYIKEDNSEAYITKQFIGDSNIMAKGDIVAYQSGNWDLVTPTAGYDTLGMARFNSSDFTIDNGLVGLKVGAVGQRYYAGKGLSLASINGGTDNQFNVVFGELENTVMQGNDARFLKLYNGTWWGQAFDKSTGIVKGAMTSVDSINTLVYFNTDKSILVTKNKSAEGIKFSGGNSINGVYGSATNNLYLNYTDTTHNVKIDANHNIFANGDIVAYASGNYDISKPLAGYDAVGMSRYDKTQFEVVNGLVRIIDGSGGGSIAGVTPGTAGDFVYELASSGNNIVYNRKTFASVLDGRYVKKAGDTMTGKLKINSQLEILSDISDIAITLSRTVEENNAYPDIAMIMKLNDKKIGYVSGDLKKGTVLGNYQSGKSLQISPTGYLTFGEQNVWHAGNDGSGSGLDADLLDGKHLSDILASNVASATKLQTPRTIWGRSFDGTANISGSLENVGDIYSTNNTFTIYRNGIYLLTSNKAGQLNINAYDANYIQFGYRGTSGYSFYAGTGAGDTVGSEIGYWNNSKFTIKTDINGHHISPRTNDTYNLGTSSARWKRLYLSGVNGGWLMGKTDGSIIVDSTNSSTSTYFPLYRWKTYTGRVFNLGGLQGADSSHQFGFYMFDKDQTENRTNASFYMYSNGNMNGTHSLIMQQDVVAYGSSSYNITSPTAGYDTLGMARFNSSDFTIDNGLVGLKVGAVGQRYYAGKGLSLASINGGTDNQFNVVFGELENTVMQGNDARFLKLYNGTWWGQAFDKSTGIVKGAMTSVDSINTLVYFNTDKSILVTKNKSAEGIKFSGGNSINGVYGSATNNLYLNYTDTTHNVKIDANHNIFANGDIVAYASGNYDISKPLAGYDAVGMSRYDKTQFEVVNGLVRIIDGSGGGSIAGVTPGTAGDFVYELASSGNNIVYNRKTFASVLDGRYVKKAGDTMTGKLKINSQLEILSDISDIAITLSRTVEENNAYPDIAMIMKLNDKKIGYVSGDLKKGTVLGNYQSGKSLQISPTGYLTFGEQNVWHAGNDGSGSGLDADLLDGKHLSDILASNVASATKLQTPRTIWGRSFDGTANISGSLENVGDIYSTNNTFTIYRNGIYLLTSNKAGQLNINAYDANYIQFGYRGTSGYSFYAGTGAGDTVGSEIGYWNNSKFTIKTDINGHHISPRTNDTYNLGTSSARWKRLYLSGVNGGWLMGKTDGSIIVDSTNSSTSTYFPLYRWKTYTGRVFNLGGLQGADSSHQFGFYMFDKDQTENRTNASFYMYSNGNMNGTHSLIMQQDVVAYGSSSYNITSPTAGYDALGLARFDSTYFTVSSGYVTLKASATSPIRSVTATTLNPGSNANASWNSSTGDLSLGIPRGNTGATGKQGASVTYQWSGTSLRMGVTPYGGSTSWGSYVNLKGATGSAGPTWNGGTITNNLIISQSSDYAKTTFKRGSIDYSIYCDGTSMCFSKWSTQLGYLSGSGVFHSIGGFVNESDIRKKIRLENVTGILNKLSDISAFYYVRRDNVEEIKKVHVGLSAQEILSILPEVVYDNYDNATNVKYYSLDYATLGAVIAVNGLKEVQQLVQDNKNEIDLLKIEIAALRERLSKLEAA